MEYSFSTVDVDPNTKLETGNGVESEYQCRPSTGGAEI
jgi:hypothetical protein